VTSAPDFLILGDRAVKPRPHGLTHVLDKGLSVRALESLVETAGAHIDILKLGWGTAYVSQGVKAKVAICEDAGIRLCPGGTLFEIAVLQGKLRQYIRWLEQLEIHHIEISDGVTAITPEEKARYISELSGSFFVISEVGSKEPDRAVVPSDWVTGIQSELAAGASFVIAEGRESGTVGLYGPNGKVRDDLVEAIVSAVPSDRVIFEAPRKDQQAWFIRRLGLNANLGNIAPDEVVALETLRLGLRADTLDLLPATEPRIRGSEAAPAALSRPDSVRAENPAPRGTEPATVTRGAHGEIQNLLERYCWTIDHGLLDEWAACFTVDGVLRIRDTELRGRSAIRAEMGERIRSRFRFFRHLPHLASISVSDSTHASARSYVELRGADSGGREIEALGMNSDELVRTGEGWLLCRRTVEFTYFVHRGEPWEGDLFA
jgi:phosphosulfolactate synthase